MSNVRLVIDNHLDTADLSAVPISSSSTPIDNLKEESRSKVVRFNANKVGNLELPVAGGGASQAVSAILSQDSSKLYILQGSFIYQYNTTNFNGAIKESEYVNAYNWGSTAKDIFISFDGVYIFLSLTTSIYRYTLDTPWDISSLNVGSEASKNFGSTTTFFTFSPDGTNLYFGSSVNNLIYHWTMGTAWDIANATDTTNSLDITDEDDAPVGIAFNSSGTRLYVAGDINNKIFQYTLDTPWDISTAYHLVGAGESLSETTTGLELLETTTGLPLQETGSGVGVSLSLLNNPVNTSISPSNDNYIYIIGTSTDPGDIIYHYGMEVEGDISTAKLLSGGIQRILGNFQNNSTISSIVLGRHNFVAGSTIRIFLYSEQDQVGLLYDSGNLIITDAQAGSDIIAWGYFDWGESAWGGAIDLFSSPASYVHWLNSPIIAQSIEIHLNAPNSEMELGRVFIGDYIEPVYNLELNHNISWVEETKQYRSEEGTLRSDFGMPIRKFEFDLGVINELDRVKLSNNFRNIGLRDDFYINMFPNDPDQTKEIDYSAIVKLTKVPKYSGFAPRYYKSKIIMEEV